MILTGRLTFSFHLRVMTQIWVNAIDGRLEATVRLFYQIWNAAFAKIEKQS